MKELGTRYDPFGAESKTFVIVELEEFEFRELEKLLEDRNLPVENKAKQAYVTEFNVRVRQLSMSNRAINAISRNGWNTPDEQVQDLLCFEEWANAVLDGYRAHGIAGRYHAPLQYARNVGVKTYMELIEALRGIA